jgi:hypothetical protein
MKKLETPGETTPAKEAGNGDIAGSVITGITVSRVFEARRQSGDKVSVFLSITAVPAGGIEKAVESLTSYVEARVARDITRLLGEKLS